MSGARLVLLTSADNSDATEALGLSLESWCRAGLLGGVAWARAADLAGDAGQAECAWADRRNWVRGPLSAVTSSGLSELWVAALRGPGRAPEDAHQIEEGALNSLSRLFGRAVAVRSLTATATSREDGFDHGDFSAMWDFHLFHDRRVTPDARSATTAASDGDALALSAALALCAAGGWSGSTAGLDLVDRVDGPVKHPRIVHSQQRVLHAPDLAFLGNPASPPWPTPVAAGVRRALPGSMPPLQVARHLARACRFECALAPPEDKEHRESPGLWYCLFGRLSKPLPRTEGEHALRRLANRTGGHGTPDADGMVPLRLDGPAGDGRVTELVGHIRQSNFPIGARSAGAEDATPDTWQTVRGAFFGLVDGGEMPSGAPTVRSGQSRDGEMLVWTDPSALAPRRVAEEQESAAGETRSGGASGAEQTTTRSGPPKAESLMETSESQYRMRFSSSKRQKRRQSGDREASRPSNSPLEGDSSARRTPAGKGGNGPPGRKNLEEIARGLGRGAESDDEPAPSERKNSGSSRSGDRDDESADRSALGDGDRLDEWLIQDEDGLATGGDHDTLMFRLAASIDGAVTRAYRNFGRYAAVRSMGDEFEEARTSRKRSQALCAGFVLVLAAVTAGAVDRRWPFLAVAWEAVTPWQARPWYDPAVWPVVWMVVVLIVLLVGMRVLRSATARLRAAVHDLLHTERLRREFVGNAMHYASELLRLNGLAEQFADHRRIITEMLHRPFGDPDRAARSRINAEELSFDTKPPQCMMVGAANAAIERVEDEQAKLQASLMQRGWLTSLYRDVLAAWRAQYERRVREDHPDPDADASIAGTTAGRDHRDGSKVHGPREDFAKAVASDGWAVTEARRARWAQSLATGSEHDASAIERYLGLLELPVAVHGPVEVAADAADFFELGPVGEVLRAEQVRHRFSWTDMLNPSAAAAPPRVSAVGSGDAPVEAASDGSGTRVLMTWRLEYSEQVRADDLQGWASARSDRPTPTSAGGVI